MVKANELVSGSIFHYLDGICNPEYPEWEYISSKELNSEKILVFCRNHKHKQPKEFTFKKDFELKTK